jgi:hypothetical protein
MMLRISRLGTALAVAGLFAALPAAAGPLADKAAEAEAMLGSGDTAGAVAAFDDATDAFWAGLPFVLRTAVFADSVEGFGRYQPRANATFRSGDTATVYLEPVGYEFVSAAGLYRAAFSTALQIRTRGGLILAESEDFGKIVWAGRSQSHEVPLTIGVTLPDLKPGDYELALTLTDDASGEMATAIFSFKIAE